MKGEGIWRRLPFSLRHHVSFWKWVGFACYGPTVPKGDRMPRIVVLLAAAVALVACAQSPEAIQPAYVSPMTFNGWSCEQMGAEEARLGSALASASAQQSQARSNDIAGVIFLGLPVASMSGKNIAPQIARYKGEQEALRQARIGGNCRT